MMAIDEIKKFIENNSESKLLTTEYHTSFGRFLAKKSLFHYPKLKQILELKGCFSMKLAEALLLRRDLEAKLTALKQEILSNALIQEGDSLDISMEELIQDYQKNNEKFSQLVVKINQRNSSAYLYDTDKLIVEALEERESLRRQHGLFNNTIETANDIRRFGRNEIRMVRTVDTKELTKKMNVVSKRLRELDGQIQQTNWLVDL